MELNPGCEPRGGCVNNGVSGFRNCMKIFGGNLSCWDRKHKSEL